MIPGCASYRAKPLTPEVVEGELATPDEHALRVAASGLRHAVLRPVELDFRRGLSPDEAAVLAVIANPGLRAQRDRRAVASAQVLQAGLLPNPQLTAGVEPPVGGPDHFVAYNAGLSWDVTSLIGREERRAAAADDAASVELDVAWQEWQVAEAAKSAAYDVLALTGQLEELREAERQLVGSRDVLRRAVERHDKTATDLAAAEAAAVDAHQAVLSAEWDLRNARLALNRSLGLAPEAGVSLRADALPSELRPPSREQLVAGLESRRLDLLALKKGYESQDAKLRAAILGQFPKINVGLSTARDTSDVRTVGLGVTVDLPVFDRGQGAIATEEATRQRLFDEYVGRVFTARADVGAAVEDIRSVDAQIAAAEAALSSFERLVKTYEQAFDRGNTDVLNLYSARGTLLQKRIDLMKLKQKLAQNWVALEVASGRYLPLGSAATTLPATGPSASAEGR